MFTDNLSVLFVVGLGLMVAGALLMMLCWFLDTGEYPSPQSPTIGSEN